MNSRFVKNVVPIGFCVIFLFVGCGLFKNKDTNDESASEMVEKKASVVIVGGTPMRSTRNIIDNASLSRTHTTLLALIERTELKNILAESGPFTLLAPTNQAFDTLPPGTIELLFKARNKDTLNAILKYHVIEEQLNLADIIEAIDSNNGRAEFSTSEGSTVYALKNGAKNIILQDIKGNIANISIYDVEQSNGTLYVIDRVLTP